MTASDVTQEQVLNARQAEENVRLADIHCLRGDVAPVLMDVLTRGGCSGLDAAGASGARRPGSGASR
ncbi:MAG: hypothetical protein ACI4O7_05900 [Aristaeellaceae bacterium]